MRMIFSVMSLLIVMVAVGMLAKKQLTALSARAVPAGTSPATSSRVTLQMQSQQIEQQVKEQVEAAMQARPLPNDAK